MVAPIDSRADLVAGEETFTLAMNFRTIALAEDLRPDALTGFGTKPTLSGMAALVWAFARPAHPKLTHDEALALVFDHAEAVGETLRMVITRGQMKADGADHPPAARTPRKRSTS
jgi:hypothetical protein